LNFQNFGKIQVLQIILQNVKKNFAQISRQLLIFT